MAVFDGVVVDVVDVVCVIRFISNDVFVETALPDSAFVFVEAAY